MKLQKMKDGSYFVVIPMKLVRAKKWQKGETVKWQVGESGDLVLEER